MKRLSLFIMLLALISLACNAGQSLPTAETQPTEAVTQPTVQRDAVLPSNDFDSSKLGTVERDITYCTMDGVELKMDVYYPPENNGRFAVTMYVHGGGWRGGDKAEGAGAVEIPKLQQAGFLVVSVNYRLAPEYKFPAMIEDVKCAVRSLRAHADEYNLDPNRIGVWGSSAGGHLAALLGTSDESAGFDVGEYLDYSSRVQAVVDMFGPVDLTRAFPAAQTQNASQVFSADQLEAASPVAYISADDPPFLILQGDQDSVVPAEQSQIFYDLLTSANVPATLVIVKNAGHGFKPEGGQISPSRKEITQLVVKFFEERLR